MIFENNNCSKCKHLKKSYCKKNKTILTNVVDNLCIKFKSKEKSLSHKLINIFKKSY